MDQFLNLFGNYNVNITAKILKLTLLPYITDLLFFKYLNDQIPDRYNINQLAVSSFNIS